MTDRDRPGRPWFGPVRVGWGIGPRTWQGWLVVVGALAVVVVVVRLLGS